MLANQASSTPPTTAASSNPVMQDGAGRLWTSLGQAPALQMAWRRLPAFRSDVERRSAVVSLIIVLPVRRANESPNCLCWQRSYWETRLCPANDHCLPGWPETGLEEINGD